MKRQLHLALIIPALALCGSPLHADFLHLEDGYIGGSPTSASYVGQDVIGNAEWFDIHSMDVGVDGGYLRIDIETTYLDNIGKYGTRLGDLFLSTNGWNPHGSAPYTEDTMLNGEDWEYAIDLVEEADGTRAARVYAKADGEIQKSYAPDGYIYRKDQEVLFNPLERAEALTSGTWSIDLDPLGGQSHVLGIRVPYLSQLQVPELGVHYALSCGNDVIEGAYTIPEPGSIFLVGMGLAGLAALRRRRRGVAA